MPDNIHSLERPLKALANRRRLAILGYLKRRPEATVGEISGAIKLSFKSTSKHLAILAAADMVERDQRSLHEQNYRNNRRDNTYGVCRLVLFRKKEGCDAGDDRGGTYEYVMVRQAHQIII